MVTKRDVFRGILMGKDMIWAPTKGLVGGGGELGGLQWKKREPNIYIFADTNTLVN